MKKNYSDCTNLKLLKTSPLSLVSNMVSLLPVLSFYTLKHNSLTSSILNIVLCRSDVSHISSDLASAIVRDLTLRNRNLTGYNLLLSID